MPALQDPNMDSVVILLQTDMPESEGNNMDTIVVEWLHIPSTDMCSSLATLQRDVLSASHVHVLRHKEPNELFKLWFQRCSVSLKISLSNIVQSFKMFICLHFDCLYFLRLFFFIQNSLPNLGKNITPQNQLLKNKTKTTVYSFF